jgi:hypothetical protein
MPQLTTRDRLPQHDSFGDIDATNSETALGKVQAEAEKVMDKFLLPVSAVLAAIILSRLVSERALALLSAEQKGRLLEVTSPIRKYGLLVVVAVFIFAVKKPLLLSIGLLLYLVGTHAVIAFQAKKLGLPAGYLKMYAASAGISLVGVVAYFVVLSYGR